MTAMHPRVGLIRLLDRAAIGKELLARPAGWAVDILAADAADGGNGFGRLPMLRESERHNAPHHLPPRTALTLKG